ncbi:MAG: hypothetical protein H8E98_02585 [Bacteroidetes bacterium]|nr:hypothetical protein [Bacteroidota bacterium]
MDKITQLAKISLVMQLTLYKTKLLEDEQADIYGSLMAFLTSILNMDDIETGIEIIKKHNAMLETLLHKQNSETTTVDLNTLKQMIGLN